MSFSNYKCYENCLDAIASGDGGPSLKRQMKSSDDLDGHEVGASDAKRKKKLVEVNSIYHGILCEVSLSILT